MSDDDSQQVALSRAILRVLADHGHASLSPSEIAQAIAADGDWHSLLPAMRRAAIALAQEGRLTIYRKGKPVDPGALKGVYRLGLPRLD
jgi:hypothetical protein